MSIEALPQTDTAVADEVSLILATHIVAGFTGALRCIGDDCLWGGELPGDHVTHLTALIGSAAGFPTKPAPWHSAPARALPDSINWR